MIRIIIKEIKIVNTTKAKKDNSYLVFETYFTNFYDFCFELPLNNMIRDALKFKFNYGSS